MSVAERNALREDDYDVAHMRIINRFARSNLIIVNMWSFDDPDNDVQVHVHRHPRGPRGINVRWVGEGSRASQPVPRWIDRALRNRGI